MSFGDSKVSGSAFGLQAIKKCPGVRGSKSFGSELMGDIGLDLRIASEAILKSRPISPMSSEPNDLEPLTPGHFLMACSPNALPDTFESPKLTSESRFKLVQQLRHQFWNRTLSSRLP